MTIKELIEKLKKYNENITVCISYDSDYGKDDIKRLFLDTGLIDGDKKTILYLSEDAESGIKG